MDWRLSDYLTAQASSDAAAVVADKYVDLPCLVTEGPSEEGGSDPAHLLPKAFRVLDAHIGMPLVEDSEEDSTLPVLMTRRRIVLLGNPGAGKTTTLRALAVAAARRALTDPSAPIPLYVDLSHWPESIPDLGSLIVHEREDQGMPPTPLARLLLLLDSLNEIEAASFPKRWRSIHEWLDTHADCRAVVASRERDYRSMSSPLQATQVLLRPLENKHIEIFVHKYLEPERAEVLLRDLVWDVPGQLSKQNMQQLARNPYQLRIFCHIYGQRTPGVLPTRGKLMSLFVLTLFQREEDKGNTRDFTLDEMIHAFSGLAAEMVRRRKSTSVPIEWAARRVSEETRLEDLLRLGTDAALVRLSKQNRFFRFTHQLLLEYFAAEAIIRQPTLLEDMLEEPDYARGRRVRFPCDDTIELVMGMTSPQPLLDRIGTRDPILALELLTGARLHSSVHDQLVGVAFDRVVALFDSQNVDAQQAAVHAMSEAGGDAVERLREILVKSKPWAKRLAVRALSRIDGDDSMDALVAAIEDRNSWVRRDASRVIEDLAVSQPDSLQAFLVKLLPGLSEERRKKLGEGLLSVLDGVSDPLCQMVAELTGLCWPPPVPSEANEPPCMLPPAELGDTEQGARVLVAAFQ